MLLLAFWHVCSERPSVSTKPMYVPHTHETQTRFPLAESLCPGVSGQVAHAACCKAGLRSHEHQRFLGESVWERQASIPASPVPSVCCAWAQLSSRLSGLVCSWMLGCFWNVVEPDEDGVLSACAPTGVQGCTPELHLVLLGRAAPLAEPLSQIQKQTTHLLLFWYQRAYPQGGGGGEAKCTPLLLTHRLQKALNMA